jgi:hypothetical protein
MRRVHALFKGDVLKLREAQVLSTARPVKTVAIQQPHDKSLILNDFLLLKL